MNLEIILALLVFLSSSAILFFKSVYKYAREKGEKKHLIVGIICAFFMSICIGISGMGLNCLISFSLVGYFMICWIASAIVLGIILYSTYKEKNIKLDSNEVVQINKVNSGTGKEKAKIRGGEKILVSMSPSDYKKFILEVEKDSKEILLLSKRLSVMFKSEEMIREMAQKRFGEGSPHIMAYKNEHMQRKTSFYKALDDGCKIYEIHNKTELEDYLFSRKHIGIGQMDYKYILQMLESWKQAMQNYPESYFVALTEETIPIKYELINKEWMVIHESVGARSDQRMNALFVYSKEAVEEIRKDFFSVWERTDNNYRDRLRIIAWIDKKIREIEEKEKLKTNG